MPDTRPKLTRESLGIADGLPLDRAQRHFRDHGDLVVRAGTHCAPLALEALDARDGCVRVSFGAGNGVDAVDAVVAALDALP